MPDEKLQDHTAWKKYYKVRNRLQVYVLDGRCLESTLFVAHKAGNVEFLDVINRHNIFSGEFDAALNIKKAVYIGNKEGYEPRDPEKDKGLQYITEDNKYDEAIFNQLYSLYIDNDRSFNDIFSKCDQKRSKSSSPVLISTTEIANPDDNGFDGNKLDPNAFIYTKNAKSVEM